MTVRDEGGAAADVLAAALPPLLAALPFSKTMRWRPFDSFAWPRPLRWLVAMHGDAVVPLEFGGLAAAAASRAARGSELDRNQQYIVHETALGPDEYEAAMAQERAGSIVADPTVRRERIWAEVSAAAEVRSAPHNNASLRTAQTRTSLTSTSGAARAGPGGQRA